MLSLQEIQNAFKQGNMTEIDAHKVNIDNEFWDRFLNDFDQNKDGFIEFDEFKNNMLQGIDKKQCLDTPLIRRLSSKREI